MSGNKLHWLRYFGLGITALVLSGCGGGSEEDDDSVAVDGNVPIAYVKRSVNSVGNPTDGARFNAGGDLYMRQFASASSSEINITGHLTNGAGDVSDPEVSYDGTRILFSMRRNSSDSWNVYEFDTSLPVSGGNPRRIISDDNTANAGNDVDPNYLADDRIIFSSNRQERTKTVMTNDNVEPYTYRDEYERENVIALHVMNSDGTNIRQITFNQSHDRNATVRSTGDIMFAHWDHVGTRNEFSIFNANPDGTGMFVLYGAHSPGNSFLHPREMQDGSIISTLMPLSGTFEGGALMLIRVSNCSENNDCNDGGTGQAQATASQINFGRGTSPNGRFTTPYPLWDNTNRVLVSYTVSCVKFNNCPTQTDPITGGNVTVEGPPQYGIYMLNMDTQQLNPLILASAGEAYTDPVALLARPRPNVISDKPEVGTTGILNVKSVYDTDNLGRMSDPVLTGSESIPKTAAPAGSSQSQVADIALMKDPSQAEYQTRPARFLCVIKAVPTPSSVSTMDVGETDFEMQQIVGYTEIEPDGSFKIEVPADTPLALAVIDSEGRAFHPHTNWIQVRPGETRTCNGCHSPRRGSAINAQPIAGTHPNTNWPNGSTPGTGETMAETRTTNNGVSGSTLQPHMTHTDIWADTSIPGVTATANLTIDYSGLTTTAPSNGFINYPEHVDPLWSKTRVNTTGSDITAGDVTIAAGANFSCTTCHNANVIDDPTDPVWQRSAGLDLSNTIAGTGRIVSYNELLIGDPIIDATTGLPMIVINNGELIVVREPSPIAIARSRSSRIVEILNNQELMAGTVNGIPQTIGSIDHSWMVNASEKRVVYEWIDLGGQYYNDPFVAGADGAGSTGGVVKMQSELRSRVSGLSQSVFDTTIHPILMNRCASCHQPFQGSVASPNNPPNTNFTGTPNRFVLTGQLEGDFNITSTMVTDLASRSGSTLLAFPSDITFANHPQDPANPGTPVLPTGSPDYTTIWNWIDAAAVANGL